jgi:uncharacterized protein (UPF0332 family)
MSTEPSKEFWDNLIKHTLETWVVPELKRREKAGTLPAGFKFYAAQIVMEPGAQREVRLNEEVCGAVQLREGHPVNIEVGAVVDFDKMAPWVAGFDLPDDDRPNAGHLTLVKNGPGWFCTFDFRYNAARTAEHVQTAREFLASAKSDHEAKRLRSFSANLFTAVELLAKARLMVHPDENLLRTKSHKYTISNFNRETHYGNVRLEYSALLNRLGALRNDARYVGAFDLEHEEASTMLATAEAMLNDAIEYAPARARRALMK